MKIRIAAAAILIFTVCIVLSDMILDEPLRLHIIANSDSYADQAVKLKVRDAVLSEADDIFSGCLSSARAIKKAEERKALLTDEAVKTLEKYGFGYKAQTEIGRYEFPDRRYGELFYPAGEYNAVKITLGRGEGKNWWCVIYPSLCSQTVGAGKRAGVKSAVLEWLKQFKEIEELLKSAGINYNK